MNPKLIYDIFSVCMDVAQIIEWVAGSDDTTGDTPVTWGTIVTGDANYYYVSAEGKAPELRTGHFIFSDGITDNFFVFSGADVSCRAVAKNPPDGVSLPSLSYRTNGSYLYQLQGNAYYDFVADVNGISGNLGNHVYIAWGSATIPTYYYDGRQFSVNIAKYTYTDNTVMFTNSQAINTNLGIPYIPIPVNESLSYNEVLPYIVDYANEKNAQETDAQGETVYEPITIEDLPSFDDIVNPTEETEPTEESGSVGGCNCSSTTIYVNADGSLTLSNDISGDFDLTIDNNADLSLNVNAAAGAFGAGAIVIDPDANINLNAGAFGAGAFGAGAIANADIDVNGELSIGDISGEINVSEISGELNIDASEISFDGSVEFSGDINLNGGDINIDQSGGNVTNNYYYTYDPSEPEVQGFTIDYNEILSEDELESILNQETYDIIIVTDETETDDFISVVDTVPDNVNELILLPSDVVSASRAVVGYGSNIINDLGLTPIYAPLALFSCFCWMIRGGK